MHFSSPEPQISIWFSTVHEIDRQDELSLTCKKSLKYNSFRLGVFMDVVKKSDPRVKLLFLTLKKVCALYKNQRC